MVYSVCSHAGTIRPDQQDSLYVDNANKYTFVLPIMVQHKQGCTQATCAMIDDRYFITAAHVVYESESQNIVQNNKSYKVLHLVIPSEYNNNKTANYDIAIGKIDGAIRCKEYAKISYDKLSKNKTVTIIGYGKAGNLLTGACFFDGQKRAGTNRLESILERTFLCDGKLDGATELEILISAGDSGGPVIDENGYLIGINSCIHSMDVKPNSDYNDFSSHVKISVYKDWIIGAIEFLKTK